MEVSNQLPASQLPASQLRAEKESGTIRIAENLLKPLGETPEKPNSPEAPKESRKELEELEASGTIRIAENLFKTLREADKEGGAPTPDSIVVEEVPEDETITIQIHTVSDTVTESESDNLVRGSNTEDNSDTSMG